MAAESSAVHETPGVVDAISSRLDEIERHAQTGEWEKVESQVKRLPQLVARVPVSERRDILLRARTCIEALRERVTQQSHEVGERLATIKTGRQAAESYRATSSMSGAL